jgi:hypothetical protein
VNQGNGAVLFLENWALWGLYLCAIIRYNKFQGSTEAIDKDSTLHSLQFASPMVREALSGSPAS